MVERIYYPVTFKHDDEIIFATQGYIEEFKGEPHDTARIYITAATELGNAERAGIIPKGSFKKADVAAITYPDGQIQFYTDERAGVLLDEYWELNKYKPTKNGRVIITVEGGFAGSVMKGTDVSLDKLNDEDFTRVAEILDLLQTRRAKLDYVGWVGDFGYYVKIGDQDTDSKDMKFAFKGGPFSKTPAVAEELEKILDKYVEKDTRGFGGGRY